MPLICRSCHTSVTQGRLPGSGKIEVGLYLLYFLPGVAYSIWRRGMAKRQCPACGSTDLVPDATPVGQQLTQQATPWRAPAAAEPVRVPHRVVMATIAVAILVVALKFWAET